MVDTDRPNINLCGILQVESALTVYFLELK